MEPSRTVSQVVRDISCRNTEQSRILKDDELNIVLLKLVEYLGHSNPVISSVAFNEVDDLPS